MPTAKTAMSVHVAWTAEQHADMQYQLEFGKWKTKHLFGMKEKNWNSKEAIKMRSPCIRVVNYQKRHRTLRHYQVVWVKAHGPIRTPRVEISHLCASIAGVGIAQCLEVKHMRLQSKRMNGVKTEEQKELVRHWNSKKMTQKFKGPLFLNDIGKAARITRNSSFLNCQRIDIVNGWPFSL